MKNKVFGLMAFVVCVLLATSPVSSANRDMVQLQTQVQNLQDQMTQMRQSFDERMGVMKNLVEQSTDNVNKMTASIDTLNKTIGASAGDTGAKVDQVSSQVQALHDAVDEMKARMAKVSKQLEDMQAAQQNLQQQQAAPATAPPQPQVQAPPPDVLYNNALRDYNAGKNDLASQEFTDYLKYYQNTDLAGNAQFYLADIEYRQGNYAQAVQDYDKVLEQYPDGNKAAAAQLKKGFALIQTGDKAGGQRELRALIARYPRSFEAQQAQDKLRSMGASATATKPAPGRKR